jgi:hypothetical protein
MDEPLLMDLMHEYGERWQIGRSDAPACWTAVERPSVTALHVIAALDLPELAIKLARAESG